MARIHLADPESRLIMKYANDSTQMWTLQRNGI